MEFTIGPASETLGFATGGSSGDWINTNFKLPASEVEIGSWEELPPSTWMPSTNEISFKLAQESWNWIDYTFKKIGNQLSFKAIGYKKTFIPKNINNKTNLIKNAT
jgi:hypothetical protein